MHRSFGKEIERTMGIIKECNDTKGCTGNPTAQFPVEEGPLVSLRLEVFYETLQDLWALQLLENGIGREVVLQMLEEGLEKPITFRQYPLAPQWILSEREQINRRIAENAAV